MLRNRSAIGKNRRTGGHDACCKPLNRSLLLEERDVSKGGFCQTGSGSLDRHIFQPDTGGIVLATEHRRCTMLKRVTLTGFGTGLLTRKQDETA